MAHGNTFNATRQLKFAAKIAEIQKLQTHRSYRDASKQFYVEGVRNFIRVMDNNLDVSTIIYSEKLLTSAIARKLVRQSRRAGIPCVNISPEQFRHISRTEKASGIGAIVRQHWQKLQDTFLQTGLCWVILETVRSPGNLGTLIRTSEAFGGAGFILLGNSIDPFDPNVVRSSMGSIYNQKFIRTSFSKLNRWLQHHNCNAIGASPDGVIDCHNFNYPATTMIFLGEERQGLTQKQRDLCQHLIRIPIASTVDSLNLAVAGSLLMYEIYQHSLQRHVPS
ncbi:TrmH family RNA methyltransferase [Calothrix rhizosoleniae]|uniref:TrmH family RNA methyltransferase n=1 Tax=Calothrix rhizosoleniae TaxID=888997 RepID=UPI000B497679|nr:RNA methyltransferase [Calothrix rhizosoleniae]